MSAAVEHRLRNSRLLQYHVIGLARRVGERIFDVIGLEVGKIAKNFIVRHTVGQHSENVRHSNTPSPDARPAAALVWFQRDTFEKLHTSYSAPPAVINQWRSEGNTPFFKHALDHARLLYGGNMECDR